MGFRTNIPPLASGFFFSPSGDDDNDGRTNERPKRTAQAAIDAAAATIPSPGGLNPARVTSSQGGGAFSTAFVLQDSIFFDAYLTTFSVDAPIAIDLASDLICDVTAVLNSQDGGVVVRIVDRENLAYEGGFMQAAGVGGRCIDISGVCDDIFITIRLFQLDGVGVVGTRITASSVTPFVMQYDTVNMTADDQTFIEFNPPNASVSAIVSAGVVQANGVANVTAYNCVSGTLVVVQTGVLSVPVIAHVHAGATMHLDAEVCNGDFVIDPGGTLIIRANVHVGDIFNSGTLIGQVGSKFFQPHSIQLDNRVFKNDLANVLTNALWFLRTDRR